MRRSTAQEPVAVGLDLVKQRDASYGSFVRESVVDLLPVPLGRVLDVGCAKGAGATLLRERGATYLAGIELERESAAAASKRYNEVVCGSVPEDLPWNTGSFDTILCYDVLEHLYDPWSTVVRLKHLLRPGGHIQVSIPNARNRRVWLPLLREGRFRYTHAGLLDITHLRFFGRRDSIEMLSRAGFEIVSVDAARPESVKARIACALTAGKAMEFLAYQWWLVGRSPASAVPVA